MNRLSRKIFPNTLRAILSSTIHRESAQFQFKSSFCTGIREDDEYFTNWAHLAKQRLRYAGKTESVGDLKARLIYQSRKRGNLENGILLSTFVDRYIDELTLEQLQTYDTLINLPDNDWDIYYWATGAKDAPVFFQSDVLRLLCEHTMNKKNELRNQQPPLKGR